MLAPTPAMKEVKASEKKTSEPEDGTRVEDLVIRALAPHPEAYQAVLAVLREERARRGI